MYSIVTIDYCILTETSLPLPLNPIEGSFLAHRPAHLLCPEQHLASNLDLFGDSRPGIPLELPVIVLVFHGIGLLLELRSWFCFSLEVCDSVFCLFPGKRGRTWLPVIVVYG